MKKDTQTENTVETQKSLSVLLDEYEGRALCAKSFKHVATENYETDVAALVKALRLATAQLEAMKSKEVFYGGNFMEIENQGVTGTLSAVAALLNQGRTADEKSQGEGA